MLRILNNQRGTVAVMAAFILPVMLGFSALVIDIGNLYLNKVQLSAAADAAVLAAAQELPKNPTQAQAVAANYARTNGQATDNTTVTISPDNRTISANISRNVSLFFAPIFNLSNSTVSAKATAQINIAASVPWIVPFVLPKTQAFDYTHQFTMDSLPFLKT